MTVQVIEYRKVPEGLAAAAEMDGPGTVFVVPSREDAKILREALCGDKCFGPSGQVWTMAELYRKTLAGLEEAGADPAWHRQVDPPDHWAILSFLLDRVFSEAGPSTPPPQELRRNQRSREVRVRDVEKGMPAGKKGDRGSEGKGPDA